MDLADRIELRRFVGREHLLWLWFETELFEGNLRTSKHGSFAMWVEGRMVLSMGRERTTIRGSLPGAHREAKEAVRRGKLPEAVGFRLDRGELPAAFVLKGDSLALSGLSLPEPPKDETPAIEVLADAPRPKRRGKAKDEADAADADYDAFYERMRRTRDVEEVLEALYADFLALRLAAPWRASVWPAIERWIDGQDVDASGYRAIRSRATKR